MYKRFCANCGKETNFLVENLCLDCYKKLKKEKRNIKKIKICKKCGRMFYKNKLLNYEKINLEEKYIKKEYFICEKCKKVYSKKYNVIIQIRNLSEADIKNILDFLNKENIILKKIEQLDTNSIDLYIFSEKISLKRYIRFLKKCKFHIKITRKLKTYDAQHGKKIYILTLLVRR